MKHYNCIICKEKMIEGGFIIKKYNCYDCNVKVYAPWGGCLWEMDILLNGDYIKYITIDGNSFEECEKKWKLKTLW